MWALCVVVVSGCVAVDPSERPQPDVGGEADVGGEDVAPGDDAAGEDVGPEPVFTVPAMPELPAEAQAPWPAGKLVHGSLVRIAHIIDGDTLDVELGGGGEGRLRLVGINAPECVKRRGSRNRMECDANNTDFSGEGEYFGVEAWEAFKAMVEDEPVVRVACTMDGEECERDLYDRYLGWVVVDGKIDVSYELAAGGFAMTYTSFPVANTADYCRAEDAAIRDGLGMWALGFDEVYALLNPGTRQWYTSRNTRCRQLTNP